MGRIKPQALLIQSKRKKGPSRINISTIVTWGVVLILIGLSLYATYKHWHLRSSSQNRIDLHSFEHSESSEEGRKLNVPNYAIMETAKGSIMMEIHKDASPDVLNKFVQLCIDLISRILSDSQKGYFKGMPFHHVIKNFVIQGGHFEGDGTAQDWILKGKISQLAISPKHEAFMIGTSKTNADVKGFDLFITTAPIPDLNDKLIVFGRVVKGEDVVQEIEEVDTDEHYQPKSPVGITNITLKQGL